MTDLLYASSAPVFKVDGTVRGELARDLLRLDVAEDTGDSYEDGPCAGAAVGFVGEDGLLRWIRTLAPAWKVEGITAQLAGGMLILTMVTDADDPAVPSHLLRATLPL